MNRFQSIEPTFQGQLQVYIGDIKRQLRGVQYKVMNCRQLEFLRILWVSFGFLITTVFLLSLMTIPNGPAAHPALTQQQKLKSNLQMRGRILAGDDDDDMDVEKLKEKLKKMKQARAKKGDPSKSTNRRVFSLIPQQDDAPVAMPHAPTPNQLWEGQQEEQPELYEVDILGSTTQARDKPSIQKQQLMREVVQLQQCNDQNLSVERFLKGSVFQPKDLRRNIAAILLHIFRLNNCLKNLASLDINSYPTSQQPLIDELVKQFYAKQQKQKANAANQAANLKSKLSDFEQTMFDSQKIPYRSLSPIYHPIQTSLKLCQNIEFYERRITQIQTEVNSKKYEKYAAEFEKIHLLKTSIQTLLKYKNILEQSRQKATPSAFSTKEEEAYQISAMQLVLFQMNQFLNILLLNLEESKYKELKYHAVARGMDKTLVFLGKIQDQFGTIKDKLSIQKIEFDTKKISFKEFDGILMNEIQKLHQLTIEIHRIKNIIHPSDERKQSFASSIIDEMDDERHEQFEQLQILRATETQKSPTSPVPVRSDRPSSPPFETQSPTVMKPAVSPPQSGEEQNNKLLLALQQKVQVLQGVIRKQIGEKQNRGIEECLVLVNGLVSQFSRLVKSTELSYLQRQVQLVQITNELQQKCIKQLYQLTKSVLYSNINLWDKDFFEINRIINEMKEYVFKPYSFVLRSGIYHSTKFRQALVKADPQRSKRFTRDFLIAERIPKLRSIDNEYHKLIPEFVVCDCSVGQIWQEIKLLFSRKHKYILLQHIPVQFVEVQRCITLMSQLRRKVIHGMDLELDKIREPLLKQIILLEEELLEMQSTIYEVYKQTTGQLKYQMLVFHQIRLSAAETSWKVVGYLSQSQLIDNYDFLTLSDLVKCSAILETMRNQYATYLRATENPTNYQAKASYLTSFLSQLAECERLLKSTLHTIESNEVKLKNKEQVSDHVGDLERYCKEANKQFWDELTTLRRHCKQNNIALPQSEQGTVSQKSKGLQIFEDPKELERLGDPKEWGHRLSEQELKLKECFDGAAMVLQYIQSRPSREDSLTKAEYYFLAMQECMEIAQEAKIRGVKQARIGTVLEKNLIPLFVHLSRIFTGKPTYLNWGQHCREVSRARQRQREKKKQPPSNQKNKQKEVKPSTPSMSPKVLKFGQIDPFFPPAQKETSMEPGFRGQPSTQPTKPIKLPISTPQRPIVSPQSPSIPQFPIASNAFFMTQNSFFKNSIRCRQLLLKLQSKMEKYKTESEGSTRSDLWRLITESKIAVKSCINKVDEERVDNNKRIETMADPEERKQFSSWLRISRLVQSRLLETLKRYDSQFNSGQSANPYSQSSTHRSPFK